MPRTHHAPSRLTTNTSPAPAPPPPTALAPAPPAFYYPLEGQPHLPNTWIVGGGQTIPNQTLSTWTSWAALSHHGANAAARKIKRRGMQWEKGPSHTCPYILTAPLPPPAMFILPFWSFHGALPGSTPSTAPLPLPTSAHGLPHAIARLLTFHCTLVPGTLLPLWHHLPFCHCMPAPSVSGRLSSEHSPRRPSPNAQFPSPRCTPLHTHPHSPPCPRTHARTPTLHHCTHTHLPSCLPATTSPPPPATPYHFHTQPPMGLQTHYRYNAHARARAPRRSTIALPATLLLSYTCLSTYIAATWRHLTTAWTRRTRALCGSAGSG